MSRWFAPFLIVLAAWIPCAAAQPSGPATEPASLSGDRIRAFFDAAPNVRRTMLERWVESGPAAEPLLKALLHRKLDADARMNVEVALQRIHDGQILGGSMITLHVKDAPAGQVISSISEQCGATVPVFPRTLLDDPQLPKLTLDLERRSFWDTMRAASEKLGIEYLTVDGEVRLGHSSDRRHSVLSPSGAFLVSADAIGYRSRLTMELAVYAEPKITVARVGDFKLDRAEDDQGKPLLPLTTRRPGGRPWFGRGGFGRFSDSGPRRIVLPYKLPADEVTKIAHFQGSISVLAQAGTRAWEIADPLTMTPNTEMVGTLPVTLQKFTAKPSGKGYDLVGLIAQDVVDTADRDQVLDSIRAKLRVTDAEGRALKLGDLDTHRTTEGTEITAEFLLPDPQNAEVGPPARLVWDIPAELRKVVLPFDFRDIPVSDPFD